MNIGYHTRDERTGAKLSGGSFTGAFDMATVNQLVNMHFCVTVDDGGRARFENKHGQRVWLYISVDADKTEAGIKALAEWRVLRDKRDAEHRERTLREEAELDEAMANLSHEEIIRRLKTGDPS